MKLFSILPIFIIIQECTLALHPLNHYMLDKRDAVSFLPDKRAATARCLNDEPYCEQNKENCRNDNENVRETYCARDGRTCPTGSICYLSTPCPAHYRTLCSTNHCLAAPCANSGTCIPQGSNYNCLCQAPYNGKNCKQVDPCQTGTPCKNGGTCLSHDGNVKCFCRTGWDSSSNCRTVDLCRNVACQNGGKCISNGRQYKCLCTEGWDPSTNCRTADPCYNVTCYNGGKCVSNGNIHQCLCKHGWDPYTDCQTVDLCYNVTCENGGRCASNGDNYTCYCTEGWNSSTHCQTVDPCFNVTCYNDGVCLPRNYTYECMCKQGLDPHTDCETALPSCELPVWSIATMVLMAAGAAMFGLLYMMTRRQKWDKGDDKDTAFKHGGSMNSVNKPVGPSKPKFEHWTK